MRFPTLSKLKEYYRTMYHLAKLHVDGIGRVAVYNHHRLVWDWWYGNNRDGWRQTGSTDELGSGTTLLTE